MSTHLSLSTPVPPPAARDLAGAAHSAASTPGARDAALSSRSLLAGQPSVKIEHNGAIYELRATRLGKLILTK